MKSILLSIFIIFTFSFAQTQDGPEDFKIIGQLLFELEQRDWFAKDIYPLMPPPPESREYFIKLRDDLTPQLADSLFIRKKESYDQFLKRIAERKVDSSAIYMATENSLSRSKCLWCGKLPDTLQNDPVYSRFKQLARQLKKGKNNDLVIPFEEMNYKGKYQLKSVDEFPGREEMYEGNLDFLSGGELSFSRFYQKEDLGVIYLSTSYCKMDCAAGYMVLFERSNGEWKIFDILLQWIT